MEPFPFEFLSHADFFALSQADKASYLITAVKELAKTTAQLGAPEQQEAAPQPLRSLPGAQRGQ